MANTTTFTMESLGIVTKQPSVFFKLQAGKGACNKADFLKAVKKSKAYSFSVQRMLDDGSYEYVKDGNGAQLVARHINITNKEPIALRNELFGFASQQKDADKLVIQLIVDTAK